MVRGCSFLLSVILAAVAGPAIGADAPPPAEVAALTAELAGLLKAQDIPGAGIALLRDHQLLWVGGIGYADRASQAPVTADTEFMIGSVSKSFTALGVMTLVEAGRIDLDAPIRQYLPDAPIENPWEASHPVTVAQVLEHTAGFDDLHFRNFATDVVDMPVTTGVRGNRVSYGVRWPPGERFSYSNPGYLLAGELIEHVSGQDFDSYMEQRVFQPLGMRHASYRRPTGGGLAQGYSDQGTAEPFPLMPDRPAGAAHASARELAQFVAAMMRREVPFLTTASLQRIETPMTSAAARAGLRSGYGLANHNREIQGFSLRRHTGGVPGFSSYYAYEPERGFGFVVLINRMAAPKTVTDAIVRFLTKDQTPPPKPSVELASATLVSHVGYYRPANPRFSLFRFADGLLGVIQIELQDGRLSANPLIGEHQALVAVSANRFRVEDELSATMAFAHAPDGGPLLLTDDGYLTPVSALSAWLPLCVTLVMILTALLAILAALVRAVLWLRRRQGTEQRLLRALPVLAAASIAAHIFLFNALSIEDLGRVGLGSLVLFLTQIAFAVLAVATLILSLRRWRQPMGRFLRWNSLISGASGSAFAVWLATQGYLGTSTWAW